MAKHVIIESYAFTPSTRTVVVNGKNIRREQLLLITNVTRNTVIYNFSDPNLGATSYTNAVTTTSGTPVESTTIVLSYNTSSMSSTDKLSLLVEESYQETTPSETQLDPVGKMRVSEPQSLIDTDFEYGIQPTKWETLTLLNNRPTAFYNAERAFTNISNISGYSNNNTVLINMTDTSALGLANGSPIFVQGTFDTANVDGWWILDNVLTNTHVTFKTTANLTIRPLFDSTKTYVFAAGYYSNSAISVSNITVAGNIVLVTTSNVHGLQIGNSVWITNTQGVANLNGSYFVSTTPTSNTFTCNANPLAYMPNASISATYPATNVLYSRPLGYSVHRPFDGGVQFTNLSPSQGYQVIRQTRRYFRYQSGKGIQFSTGSILKPALSIDDISSSGTTCTITCRVPHGMLPGANITVSGCEQTAYNGTFTVTSVGPYTLTYTALTSPAATPATGFPITVSPASWYGARIRIGMFDNQNGFFFEFDGQTLWCVKRSSTQQISGTVGVTAGSHLVTGTNTKFATQLKPGDAVVIRGMTYICQSINSNTDMYIYPEYRGITSTTNVVVSKTIDTRYAQSSWNIDTCDGNGASLFNLDLTKMQMFYIDYSWYGAGAIRFGFKNNRGEVIYCHRIANNNINTEAYMRSGNMAARYETNTLGPSTYLTGSLTSAAGTGSSINVADTSLFPPSGIAILVRPGTQSAPIEYISYSAKTATTLTIASRAIYGGASTAQDFTYSVSAPIQVELYTGNFAPAVSHWGSSVMMDGKYDDDKSLVFNIGQNSPLRNLTANQRFALISLRVAPSVDNGFVGLLGSRELVNRMQMILRQMDAYVSAPYRIELILNGTPAEGLWQNVGGSSLAQYILHANATTISGGENIFSFFTNETGTTQQELTIVRDLGTSILGGGYTANANVTLGKYPDGPDIVTLCCTPLLANRPSNINARMSWTEAQA
jgi:hypothetical protein